MTRSDTLETQALKCLGTTGAFAIKFRQQITSSLDFSATEAQVRGTVEHGNHERNERICFR